MLLFYKIGPNVQSKITDDVYDDLNPRFIEGSSKIIFSSNRSQDSLKTGFKDPNRLKGDKDLFEYDLSKKSLVLKNITNTDGIDENFPDEYGKGQYTYLSDESGVYNRYVAQIDSVISHIDTTMHYRYIDFICEEDNTLPNGKYTLLP